MHLGSAHPVRSEADRCRATSGVRRRHPGPFARHRVAGVWYAVGCVLFALACGAGSVRAEEPPALERVLVLGERGTPVADAVLLRAGSARADAIVFDPRREVLARSDEEGRLVLPDGAQAAGQRLLVSAAGHAPALLPLRGPAVTLRLLAAQPTQGRVRLQRAASQDAAIRLLAVPLPGEGEVAHACELDAAGRWSLPQLHRGRYHLWLRQATGRWQPLGLLAAGGVAAHFESGSGSLAGTLLDAGGTRDAAAALARLVLRRLAPPAAEESLKTDERGRFLFAGLAPGVWSLEFADAGWEFEGQAPDLEVRADEHRDSLVFFARARQWVQGQIQDAERRPVAGARVELAADPRRRAQAVPAAVVTDDAGRFRLGPASPGAGYRLLVAAAGHAPFASDGFEVDEGRTTELKPIRLLPAWSLEILVRDPDGRPVPGAFAQADDVERPLGGAGPLARSARGGADGRLVLEGLAPSDVRARVSASGYQSVDLEVAYPSTGAARSETVYLLAGLGLRGVVRAGASGTAPPYALQLQSVRTGELQSSATGPDGAFAFTGLAPGTYDLRVREGQADGKVLASLRDISAGDDEVIEVLLPARAALRVGVTGAQVGDTPVEISVQARVRAGAEEADVWQDVAVQQVAAVAELQARVEGLAPGTYGVQARQGARAAARELVHVVPGEAAAVELWLPGAGRVAGLFFDADGRAVLGVRVRLSPAEMRGETDALQLWTVSDERGDFVFDAVGAGAWDLVAERAEHAPIRRRLEVHEGEVLVLDDLVLAAGARLEGRIQDAQGRAMDGAWLRLRQPEVGGTVHTARSDGQGRYRFFDLAAGTWELAWLEDGAVRERAWVELAADEERLLDLDASASGRLRVELTRRGLPVPGARVLVRREATADDPAEREREGRTDAQGLCELHHLAAGAWWVRVHWGSALMEQRVLLDDGGEVQLDLEVHEALLRGQVVTPDGQPVPGARLDARPTATNHVERIHGFADTQGRFQLTGVPLGTYDLRATADGFPPGRLSGVQAEVPGAVFDVEVVVGRGGDVELTVVDAESRPVVGARVWAESMQGELLLPAAVLTAGRGRARLRGLPEGRVQLRVQAPGYGRPRLEVVDVLEGEVAEARIAVRAPGTLELFIDAARLDPVRRVRIDILRLPGGECVARRLPLSRLVSGEPWEPLPLSGQVSIADLEPGPYEVVVHAGPRFEPVRERVQVVAGRSVQVALHLEER